MDTLSNFIRLYAEQNQYSPAIAGLNRDPLSYGGLLKLVEKTHQKLRRAGLTRTDAIAIVLPEGPEMTAAFIAAACSLVAAPLNPDFSPFEFGKYFTNLQVKALITISGFCLNAIEAARQLDILTLFLTFSNSDPAGCFDLRFSDIVDQNDDEICTDFAETEDLLLVSHTSGTTSDPKIVPLTHRNICISAQNIIRSLELTSQDRCLNVMPVFHIHGSVICTISTLLAGGTVISAPRFNAVNFLQWLAETRPTWFSAAPSIHQSVMDQVSRHPEKLNGHSLRFIRSSAGPMPPALINAMENGFNVPFIEGYGLSETAHLLTSNFLPPFRRKPGSVGIAAGPEVAIMNAESSQLLGPFETGEIVARGLNVMSGYQNNPEANENAFCDGWFRTGDLGHMDEEGYFFVTGRIKEMINRGGEKINPREIDAALMEHPQVKEAVAFAIPSERLGEEVAAAIVLNSQDINQAALKHFLASKLAYFKIPSQIVIAAKIPKSPTGKNQRSGLARDFGLSGFKENQIEQTVIRPQTQLESEIAAFWEKILQQKNIGINQTFISLGGDSILLGNLAIHLQERFSIKLSLIDLFESPTVRDQALLIEDILKDAKNHT